MGRGHDQSDHDVREGRRASIPRHEHVDPLRLVAGEPELMQRGAAAQPAAGGVKHRPPAQLRVIDAAVVGRDDLGCQELPAAGGHLAGDVVPGDSELGELGASRQSLLTDEQVGETRDRLERATTARHGPDPARGLCPSRVGPARGRAGHAARGIGGDVVPRASGGAGAPGISR